MAVRQGGTAHSAFDKKVNYGFRIPISPDNPNFYIHRIQFEAQFTQYSITEHFAIEMELFT